MNNKKYPDEMLIIHLQAQIDRILDYDFGSIVSNAEYRGLGKTNSIVKRVHHDIIKNGIDSGNVIVAVGNLYHQTKCIKELVSLIGKSNEMISGCIERVIHVGGDSLMGYRFSDETKIVYLDGVDKKDYEYMLMISYGQNITFRGFVNL